jgi:hypothetical protein
MNILVVNPWSEFLLVQFLFDGKVLCWVNSQKPHCLLKDGPTGVVNSTHV